MNDETISRIYDRIQKTDGERRDPRGIQRIDGISHGIEIAF
jgi:hypothetical protein